ncbi:uncharacterized protein B0H18DRAFT_1050212 [Fomitopsis serialis]|uniref:uncharacterized protein n=1 Tax=Fomitopsis serialis TaxID=139415 RepID=UPI0020084872|nr:uncharacterized protein B0H18DRAFT_1050212 [Neoantrodia serialis]KAH9913240.1 hypothetical protein B0H18DRAFT_1050212 [Neoantrodia serialis]
MEQKRYVSCHGRLPTSGDAPWATSVSSARRPEEVRSRRSHDDVTTHRESLSTHQDRLRFMRDPRVAPESPLVLTSGRAAFREGTAPQMIDAVRRHGHITHRRQVPDRGVADGRVTRSHHVRRSVWVRTHSHRKFNFYYLLPLAVIGCHILLLQHTQTTIFNMEHYILDIHYTGKKANLATAHRRATGSLEQFIEDDLLGLGFPATFEPTVTSLWQGSVPVVRCTWNVERRDAEPDAAVRHRVLELLGRS